MNKATHHDYMSQALTLAQKGRFSVSPNPMVGCVLVKNHRVIGEGFHRQAGGPHAEIVALKAASEDTKGATAYVTLEPCCHVGRTAPCILSLIEAGIKEVYVACKDPNPLVSGNGIQALRAANIDVHVGLLEEKAIHLNKIFFHHIQHKRPFVIAKWAMSLDGKTITHDNDSRAISSDAAQQFSHALRHEVDAILIGAETARRDNPSLTARYPGSDSNKQPVRIILSSKGDLPLDLTLFSAALPGQTIVATTELVSADWRKKAEEKNITVWVIKKNARDQVELDALLEALYKHQLTSLLIEGGMSVHQRFMEEGLINEFRVYLAPVIIGTLPKKQPLTLTHVSKIDHDYYIEAIQDPTIEDKTHV